MDIQEEVAAIEQLLLGGNKSLLPGKLVEVSKTLKDRARFTELIYVNLAAASLYGDLPSASSDEEVTNNGNRNKCLKRAAKQLVREKQYRLASKVFAACTDIEQSSYVTLAALCLLAEMDLDGCEALAGGITDPQQKEMLTKVIASCRAGDRLSFTEAVVAYDELENENLPLDKIVTQVSRRRYLAATRSQSSMSDRERKLWPRLQIYIGLPTILGQLNQIRSTCLVKSCHVQSA